MWPFLSIIRCARLWRIFKVSCYIHVPINIKTNKSNYDNNILIDLQDMNVPTELVGSSGSFTNVAFNCWYTCYIRAIIGVDIDWYPV